MNLKDLKARLEELKADASAILDHADAEGRSELTAEEGERVDAIRAEIDETKQQIARAERLADLRREMRPRVSRPAGDAVSDEPNPATTGGFRSLAEFAHAVRSFAVNGDQDRRLFAAPSNVHQGDGGSGEGFLIPAEYREQIYNAITEVDDFLSRFDLTPTAARSVEMLRDETTPWGAAGIQSYWRAEGSQMTPSKMATKAARLEINDLYALAAVTEETLADAPRMEAQLTLKAAQAIAWKVGEAVVRGNGVGQPLGFLTAPAKIAVAKEAGQADDSIVAANVNKMYARLHMIPGDQPFWMANRDTFPQLQALAFGTDTPLFYPPAGITTAPNGTLLGYPIVYTEHAATLGDEGDLVLVSPAGYQAFVRGAATPTFSSSMHLWFDYATQAFRWTFRMGGQPILSAPVTPARGSATKSHFVALAARTS